MTVPIALKQVCRKLIVLGVVSELVADSVRALVVKINFDFIYKISLLSSQMVTLSI